MKIKFWYIFAAILFYFVYILLMPRLVMSLFSDSITEMFGIAITAPIVQILWLLPATIVFGVFRRLPIKRPMISRNIAIQFLITICLFFAYRMIGSNSVLPTHFVQEEVIGSLIGVFMFITLSELMIYQLDRYLMKKNGQN